MKKNFKKSAATMMVLGMTLTGATGVFAGTQLEKISAYLNHGISFNVDGAAYSPTDGNGKKLAPITYNNSTYLPVRAIADALHVPVSYDGKKGQVIIGEATSNPSTLSNVSYSAAQKEAIQKAFAQFDGFETAYAPQQMIAGDTFKSVGAGGDGVSFTFNHMKVDVSPRDYSDGYNSKDVKLSNGVTAKWYTPDQTGMLTFKLDDRYVTISSPDHKLSQAQLQQVAVSVQKVQGNDQGVTGFADVKYTQEQSAAIRKAFAKFQGFETAYAPHHMIAGDSFKNVAAGGDGVNFVFNHMNVTVSPKDYSFSYDGKNVKLPNGVTAKWYTPDQTDMLTFKLDDRYVTLSSANNALTHTQLEQMAVSVKKVK
ncbi:Copper amine oxidase N-terminal domain-containing protein [Paenibacillus sp. ov031]|uniref:stalk domain-containing protein n=1 Tax=unclassified Paenibacillus TaxID=185978 RepID=UPI00089A48A2|nr:MULTISPECIES: stalk domain-containing protein [unclassified Paenibacillus]SEB27785.1 Copper amine oxidase N-terminal domain-containing protein [Paenibacillus sp. 276b]SHN84463.1 Copper amine oxidase N-terminal domain-containing protein [Paenibacillus sp. ov031]